MRHAHDYLIEHIEATEPFTFEDFPEQDRLSAAGRDFVKLFARHKTALQTFGQTQAAQVAALRLQQTRKWRDLCTAQTQFAAAESLAGALYVEEVLNVGGQGSLTTAKWTLMSHIKLVECTKKTCHNIFSIFVETKRSGTASPSFPLCA